MRHLVSRIRRSRIALARNRGRRRSNFGPKCRRSTSFAAQAPGQVFQVRAWGRCRPCAYRERNETEGKRPAVASARRQLQPRAN